jgi:hypothetical protein
VLSKAGDELLDQHFRNGAAAAAYEQTLAVVGHEDSHAQAPARGAASGGIAGVGFGKIERDSALEPAGFLSVNLECAAAVGADVIEAALGLAGVDDFSAAAFRAADNLFERAEWHEVILS